jgi:hypothetical protein
VSIAVAAGPPARTLERVRLLLDLDWSAEAAPLLLFMLDRLLSLHAGFRAVSDEARHAVAGRPVPSPLALCGG